VKNTLAIVQTIADQTARRSSSLAIFHEAFDGRLRALAVAHGVLTKTRWSGVELTELLRESLAPYRDRVRLQGSPIMLPSQMIVPLSMILHELMTNAVKYGSLSTSGHVEINSGPDDHRQMIFFNLAGTGRASGERSKKAGFGSTLIERVAMHDLEGKCTLDFQSDGLRCSLHFPIQHERNTVEASSASGTSVGDRS
jgi:two-component sensor histidine kinase